MWRSLCPPSRGMRVSMKPKERRPSRDLSEPWSAERVSCMAHIPSHLITPRCMLAFYSHGEGGERSPGDKRSLTPSICLMPPAAATAFIHAVSAQGDLFGYVADLTGGISSSMVGMVLPGLIYLEATRGIRKSSSVAWYRRGCYVLIALGVVTVFAVPTGVVLSVLGYD